MIDSSFVETRSRAGATRAVARQRDRTASPTTDRESTAFLRLRAAAPWPRRSADVGARRIPKSKLERFSYAGSTPQRQLLDVGPEGLDCAPITGAIGRQNRERYRIQTSDGDYWRARHGL